ncbi:MAG: co-chaperone DjlA [Gammaproteobacteria bacterium]|jgi:DnaJ like chaperone protein
MAWWGKLLGGAFGFMLGGPLGAVLGAALGHQYDKGLKALPHMETGQREAPEQRELNQTAFFTATFSVMGHIAKADGVVTKEEIRFAEAVMQQMQLTPDQRKTAINLFQEGKKAGFRVDAVLDQFHAQLGRQRNLIRMFLEIQVQAAYGDGRKHPAEHRILQSIASRLGIPGPELDMIEEMVLASMHFRQGGRQQEEPRRERRRAESPGIVSLQDAYAMLEIERSSSDAEVKKAYRRMISRHHPDKLASKGLPEEMMQMATEKTRQIKQAYEMIKQSRGMR